jgi:predicted permease
VAALDLAVAFQPGLMLAFYIGAFSGFAFGFMGARFVFHRPLTDSVAIAFACTFSNSLLLGVPITERAYGAAALAGNFAIISVHAPLIYSVGIIAMEWARSREAGSVGAGGVARQVLRGVVSQPLLIGIACGFAVNLSGVAKPAFFAAAVDMVAAAGLPAALFGLGGVLWRYRPEGDKGAIAMVVFASLVLHPMISYGLARFGFGLGAEALRSVTITAARCERLCLCQYVWRGQTGVSLGGFGGHGPVDLYHMGLVAGLAVTAPDQRKPLAWKMKPRKLSRT